MESNFNTQGVLLRCSGVVLTVLLFYVSSSYAADKEVWQPISAGVLAKVKPGYPGKTAGVTVDPANGDAFPT